MRSAFKVGGRYNWKNQPERLIYIGRGGCWHQFVKVDDPAKVWCEVLTEDLQKLEETAPQPPHADAPEQLLQSIGEFGETQNQAPQAQSVEQAIVSLIDALRRRKGWTFAYADATVRDAIDRTAPQARELSDEGLMNIFRKVSRSWPPNGPHSEQIIEFARAVLAERSSI